MLNKDIEQIILFSLLERYLNTAGFPEMVQKLKDVTRSKLTYNFAIEELHLLEEILERAQTISCLYLQPSDQPLKSIFSEMFGEEKNKYYDLTPLKIDKKLIPGEIKWDRLKLSAHLNDFLGELDQVTNPTRLNYLLEKYFWCIPCSRETSDVSVYQYFKTITAISFCLASQNQVSSDPPNYSKEIQEHPTEEFILVGGDLSGIQKYIFSTSSKGAAKSLKGRSVYLGLLAEIVVRYMLRQLQLPEYNLLYNGGGNFYILAPISKLETIKKARTYVLETLLEIHRGEIYFGIGIVPFQSEDFANFSDIWRKVSEEVGKLKQKKWSEVDLVDNFSSIFGPLDKGSKEKTYCEVCRITDAQRKVSPVDADEDSMECEFCKSFRQLTSDLSEARYLRISYVARGRVPVLTYQDIFKRFGVQVDFLKAVTRKAPEDIVFQLNNTDFLPTCDGYKLGAFNLPLGNNGILPFDEIASQGICVMKKEDGSEEKKGDPKLAYMKLDVDNLGILFINGFCGNKSIARITTLSRMLEIFFGGFINYIIEEMGLKNKLYVVFSGGDDTFVVGAWNQVLAFTERFYREFRKYTCRQPRITFSAGIAIFPPKYPLSRGVILAEEALEDAKIFTYAEEKEAGKNKVSLFEKVFNWCEFNKVIDIKNDLVEIVSKEKNTRAILYKVLKSTIGFKKILEETTNRNLYNLKFWRLAYYLRDLNKKHSETIINHYQEIVIDNLTQKSKGNAIRNIMIIPVAVKWAEMETKSYKEKEEDCNE